MRRVVLVIAVTWGLVASAASAGYAINGDLSDWGVTPYTHWAPAGTADYTQTNNVNLYNADAYGELFDFKAMYFDNDAENFYVAVVGANPMGPSDAIGDLGIDLNHDMTLSFDHGVVTGLEYAFRVGSHTAGQVVLNPAWGDTIHYQWPEGWQGSPYQVIYGTGTVVGSGMIATQYYPDLEGGTYTLELSIPRSLFPGNGGDPNDIVGLHITQWCGNDSINLFGDIDPFEPPPPPPPPPVPAPAALLLACLGTAVVGGLRRRKVM